MSVNRGLADKHGRYMYTLLRPALWIIEAYSILLSCLSHEIVLFSQNGLDRGLGNWI